MKYGIQNKSFLIGFAFIVCTFTVFGNEQTKDSLRLALQHQTGTERLNTLIDLSNRIVFTHPLEAIDLANEAIRLAEETKNVQKRFQSLKIRGYAHGFAGKITQSMADLQEGLDFYTRTRDSLKMAESLSDLGNLYQSQGIYDKALEQYQLALQIREKTGDRRGIANSLNHIGSVYWRAGQHDDALNFYHQAIYYFELAGLEEERAVTTANIGEIYRQLNEPEQALEYFNRAIKLNQLPEQNIFRAKNLNNIGRVYLQKKDYRRAIRYFNQAVRIQYVAGDTEGYAQSHYHLGMAWLQRGGLLQALEHFNLCSTSARRIKNNELLIKSLRQISQIHAYLGNHQVAYENLVHANLLNDSLFNIQQKRLTEELRTRYETEKYMIENRNLKNTNRTNEIIIAQQQAVIVLTIGIGLLVLLTVILFLQRRRSSEKLKTVEMEQKLLRSQMNPHFIFNALSLLQNTVLHKTPKENVNLIASMASLMRLILDNSTHEFIPFEKEIQTLRIYLQLQQQRFAGQFDFDIHIESPLEDSDILVPPMLPQPFIENAIEHGFFGIQYHGVITLHFKAGKECVICEINDNGIGYNQGLKLEKSPHHHSYGIEITRQRIAILQKKYGMFAALDITDETENGKLGTKVTIIIPIKYNNENE